MIEAQTQSSYFIIYTFIYFITQINTIVGQLLPIAKWLMVCFLDYKTYTFSNKESRNKIECFIESSNYWCKTYDNEGKPCGLVVEKSYFPKYYIQMQWIDVDPYIFCTSDIFEKIDKIHSYENFKKINVEKIEQEDRLNMLTSRKDSDSNQSSDSSVDDNEDKPSEGKVKQNIKHLVKSNTEYSGYNRYVCRNIKIPNDHMFNEKQNELFREMMKFYNENKYAKVLISGDIGTGKSYFSYILARKLNCYLCDDFNPTEPAEGLTNLYTSKKLSGDEPLIVLIDEVDVMIKNIHENRIKPHKHYPILTRDKMSWNSFLDKISYGIFPHLILIMTSNVDKNKLDRYDPSYLREGRVDIYSHF